MKRTLIEIKEGDFPSLLAPYMSQTPVYNSSCSPEAAVFYIPKEEGFFLKRAPSGSLYAEKVMTEYYHSLGLSSEVVMYLSDGSYDYLLTRRIPGEDCCDPEILARPEHLVDTFAGALRTLHETKASACPVRILSAYKEGVMRGIKGSGSHYEPDLFAGLFTFASFEEARALACRGLSELREEVLIHGDYCLPNVILDQGRLSGFIDVGAGGIGDRHMDLVWGIWTLNFNLKTTAYSRRFMEAYGSHLINRDLLRSVAAMEVISE